MATVVISLGSNVGDRLKNLQAAGQALSAFLKNLKISSVYETAPMYLVSQPLFLNAAAIGETTEGPLSLLRRLKTTEMELGRQSGMRYGPREIDLDLIAYGVAKYVFVKDGETLLSVPHPRVVERRFVIEPLHELNPHLLLPGLGAVDELLKATADQASSVRKISDALLPVLRA